MKRLARILGTLMIVAGLGSLGWAVTVWQWQDPFTAFLTYRSQQSLGSDFEQRLEEGTRRPAPATAIAVRKALPRDAVDWRKDSKKGDPVARLRIPSLGLSLVVVNGTDTNTLKRGPGRYLGSAMPGEGELVYVAGHRTTYGAPFSKINELKKGDQVFVELPYGTFEYRITGHRIVSASKTSELKSRGFEQLALQACHPRFFATQRIIAYAKPVAVTPPGDDTATPYEAIAAP